MPHTNKRSPASKPGWSGDAKFINISLPKDVTQKIKESPFQINNLDDALASVMSGGYKLSCRFDKINDCYSAWLIAPDYGENKGYILSGRGSTPSKAVKQVCYIHFVVLEMVWTTDLGRDTSALDD